MEAFGGDAHTADSAATLAAACRWAAHYLSCKASVCKPVLLSDVAHTRGSTAWLPPEAMQGQHTHKQPATRSVKSRYRRGDISKPTSACPLQGGVRSAAAGADQRDH